MVRVAVLGFLVAGCTTDETCVVGDAEARIVRSETRGHYVQLDIEREGCPGARDNYALWWNGHAATSDPPQLQLELQHYPRVARGDRCAALVIDSVWFDLAPLEQIAVASEIKVTVVTPTAYGFSYTAAIAERPDDDVIPVVTGCNPL